MNFLWFNPYSICYLHFYCNFYNQGYMLIWHTCKSSVNVTMGSPSFSLYSTFLIHALVDDAYEFLSPMRQIANSLLPSPGCFYPTTTSSSSHRSRVSLYIPPHKVLTTSPPSMLIPASSLFLRWVAV
uniref:Uncharacterized protein n=1 Tax=Oryza brachyantha TaxID=4533 RepID=J3LJ12_ORYBR